MNRASCRVRCILSRAIVLLMQLTLQVGLLLETLPPSLRDTSAHSVERCRKDSHLVPASYRDTAYFQVSPQQSGLPDPPDGESVSKPNLKTARPKIIKAIPTPAMGNE